MPRSWAPPSVNEKTAARWRNSALGSKFSLLQSVRRAIPGIAITGFVGGLIGSFLGGWTHVVISTGVGSVIGYSVWSFGGRLFFLFIIIGALLSSALSFYLVGTSGILLGAACGGAIGGFLGVNVTLFYKQRNIE
jgi:hypothetical protein